MTTPDDMRAAANQFGVPYDELITPFNFRFGEDAVRLAGVGAGTRLLDVAAGGGALSIPAAKAGADVMATDIAPVLLERLEARAQEAGINTIETRVMDGHALELEDSSFDVAASQFGIMLFPDRRQGMRELVRVTKPGGKGVMVVFGPPPRVEVISFFIRALQTRVPGFTPPADIPLFTLADESRFAQELTDAGLMDIGIETVDHGFEMRSGTQLWDMLTSAAPPLARLVQNLSEEHQSAVRETLDDMVRERAGGGEVAVLNMQAKIGIGTK